jgi:hypothetical protein
MNRTPRNQTLLAQMSAHNKFRETLAPAAFKVGDEFAKAVADVTQDRRLSPVGRKDAARSHLTTALSALQALQKPVDAYREETTRMRASIKQPSYDKSDIVGAMNRHRMLDRSLAMTAGQRSSLMIGKTRSVAFVDALYEVKDDPWMAGIDVFNPNELQVFEAMKQERLVDLNPELMPALEARDTVEAEIAMIMNIAKNDLESDAADLTARAA